VPIAQTEIEAEKVFTLERERPDSGRPLRGTMVKEHKPTDFRWRKLQRGWKTKCLLGEGLTDPLKPGERRLISYANRPRAF